MLSEPDVRDRQRAAAALHRLLADVDYLATPEQAAAATSLARASRHAHPLLVTGQLADWKDSWDNGIREPLVVADDQHADAIRLARATLTVHQQLTGPETTLANGTTVQVGDQLRVVPHGADHIYTRHGHRLDAGALATVTALETDPQSITLEIATADCSIAIDIDDPAARTLHHGYAERDPAGADHRLEDRVRVGGTARDRSLGVSR